MGRRERRGEERRAQGRQTGARRAERGPSRLLGRRSEAGRARGLLSQWGRAGAGGGGGAEWETTVSVEHDVLRKGGQGSNQKEIKSFLLPLCIGQHVGGFFCA